jgi:translation initiation factor 5B
MIRKPIITVLGHIDAGKTRFLDSVRGTTVVEKEAGGITQHIGATEVPIHVIKKLSGDLLQVYKFDLAIPGLLFIDTPGHEAFTNLRERGGSIADLAVLIVDINKGCQSQTFEVIEIVRNFKVPFVVVANKLDTLFEWQSAPGSITDNLKNQSKEALDKLDKKIYNIVGQMHEKGFSTERFDRITDFTKQVPIIPVSAKAKEGIPEVLLFLAGLSQRYLEERLKVHVKGPGKGTVLEVKEEKGLGKTIDVILYDGKISVGDELAVGAKHGEVITTKVRALLEPKPMEEMRELEKKFNTVKEITAASGVKIAAPNLENALAGSPVIVVRSPEDVDRLKEEIKDIKIESDAIGPILKTDTLGTLEAIAILLEKEGLKVRKADVGEVTRKDLIEIESIKEKDPYKGVIFAFNTKVNPDIQSEAEKAGVRIFSSNVVYQLIEEYNEWVKGEKEKEKKKRMGSVTYPFEIKIMPDHVFRQSKPAIVGIKVLRGKLHTDVEVMKKGKIVGKIHALQADGEPLKEAGQNKEVAVSIMDATVGRNIKEKDILYSVIPKNEFPNLEKLSEEFTDEELQLIEEIKEMEKKLKR